VDNFQVLKNNEQFGELLKTDPNKALQLLYDEYYDKLCKQVYLILHDKDKTEDIVQEVLVSLWRQRDELKISSSIEAYMKRSCRNRALNFIRDNKIKIEEETVLMDREDTAVLPLQVLEMEEMDQKINQIINFLPDRCRTIFTLSRFEDMSYAEIANELNISTKTVEHQISKALKILREKIYINLEYE
jgi:RNA polymerase sigma-70 factor (ECF subfamily)